MGSSRWCCRLPRLMAHLGQAQATDCDAIYTDITIASIAGVDTELSFSSDTNMGECLIVGRKLSRGERANRRGQFVSLRSKPNNFVHALELSKAALSGSGFGTLKTDHMAAFLSTAEMLLPESRWMRQLAVMKTDGCRPHLRCLRCPSSLLAFRRRALAAGGPKGSRIADNAVDPDWKRGVDHQFFVSVAHRAPFIKQPASPTSTYPSCGTTMRKEKREWSAFLIHRCWCDQEWSPLRQDFGR